MQILEYANFGICKFWGNPLYPFSYAKKVCVLRVCVKITNYSFQPFSVWILQKKKQTKTLSRHHKGRRYEGDKSFPFNYKTESTLENSRIFFSLPGLGIIVPYTVWPE